jgi:hypothetical protein
MENAMDSEKEAVPAFDQLERCARDDKSGGGRNRDRERLICFANASRLTQEYPSLFRERFQALASQNPKLVSLLQITGL